MFNVIKNAIQTIILSIVVLFSAYIVIAAWSEPTVAPTGGNASAPLDVSATGQTKAGGLILNTGAAANGLIVSAGNVGIGTANPSMTLDVNGTVRMATTTFSAAISGGTYIAQWVSPSTSGTTYTINLRNGTASGGTLTFLSGSSFPANAKVMFISAQYTHETPGSAGGASNPSCSSSTAQGVLASSNISIFVGNNSSAGYTATCSGLFIGIIQP